jgi:hypothetical protein
LESHFGASEMMPYLEPFEGTFKYWRKFLFSVGLMVL